ncbi:Golgi to ER traffic protein 4 homolog [Notothenia coriiceps]|uniref:Golgi to ER traffic protein 4 homolog n=1 Tax=Notothenia coriiceps TaxID=8208 RepID=A0A6I9MTW9_9TELE|nr:PREDICTED: Golgi to ER traffic protein 4 homolog [Notothenia coriiceps]
MHPPPVCVSYPFLSVSIFCKAFDLSISVPSSSVSHFLNHFLSHLLPVSSDPPRCRFLCLKNKSGASVVFSTYTEKHPSIEKGPPFVQPLLNFIWFLLLAVDGGKLTVFTVLCEQYQPSLKRDPMYNEYLDRIGQVFFGVPPKQSPSYGGLLGEWTPTL